MATNSVAYWGYFYSLAKEDEKKGENKYFFYISMLRSNKVLF